MLQRTMFNKLQCYNVLNAKKYYMLKSTTFNKVINDTKLELLHCNKHYKVVHITK